VREKLSCRSCETITQPRAPFHAIAGPSLLAMMLVEKYANHQPLNRQSEHYAREGVELSVSTMADHVGACAAVPSPLCEIKAHVFVVALSELLHLEAGRPSRRCSPHANIVQIKLVLWE
jgi:transposase